MNFLFRLFPKKTQPKMTPTQIEIVGRVAGALRVLDHTVDLNGTTVTHSGEKVFSAIFEAKHINLPKVKIEIHFNP